MRAFGTEISANRVAGGEPSEQARDSIVSESEVGASPAELAREFRCTAKCIRDTISRYNKTGSNASRPRSRQPPKLTRREKRTLLRTVRKTPKITYQELVDEAYLQKTVSFDTLYRALLEQGLKNFRAKRRPKINRATALLRLRFCREYRNFAWRSTPFRFSDECSVQKGRGADAEWVFCYPYEKWQPRMISAQSTSRAPQQMVWASIWIDSNGRTKRSPLIIMERDTSTPRHGYSAHSYTEALEEGLLNSYRPGERFMQDGAGIHRATHTHDFLVNHGIWTIDFPPYSPDLNLIEHL